MFTTNAASKVFLNIFQPSEKANGERDLGSSCLPTLIEVFPNAYVKYALEM